MPTLPGFAVIFAFQIDTSVKIIKSRVTQFVNTIYNDTRRRYRYAGQCAAAIQRSGTAQKRILDKKKKTASQRIRL